MTDSETSVYVTDREELRHMIADVISRQEYEGRPLVEVHPDNQERCLKQADRAMPVVDSLLEWGNGHAKQAEQSRATAGNLQKLLDASQEALRQQTEQADRIFALCGESPEEECTAGSLAAFVEEYIGRAQAGEASREAVEHVIDEHCCSADVTETIVAKLFEFYRIFPREAGDSAADETRLANQLDHVADLLAFAPDEARERLAAIGNRLRGVQPEAEPEAWKEQRCARDGIIAAFCPCDRPDVPGLPSVVQSEVDTSGDKMPPCGNPDGRCGLLGGMARCGGCTGMETVRPRVSEVDTEAATDDCGACYRCVSPKWGEFQSHPAVCATCGNKRCPHASDHNHACTGSNAYGQPGSDYAPLPSTVSEVDTEAEYRDEDFVGPRSPNAEAEARSDWCEHNRVPKRNCTECAESEVDTEAWQPSPGERVVGKLFAHPEDEIVGEFVRHVSDFVSRLNVDETWVSVLRHSLRPSSSVRDTEEKR